MIILEKPYISDFLLSTIKENQWNVLENDVFKGLNLEKDNIAVISSEEAKESLKNNSNPLIYANSENAITWVLENLKDSNLSSYIKLFKDKIAFRELLKGIYPDFYFIATEFDNLKTIEVSEIRFPIVIKPAIGFLSFGVHTVKDELEWNQTLIELEKEMELASKMYPAHVVNSSKFIIEQMIEGEEFAIDAYYNKDGEAVVLNIFQHPFFDEKDVSDRIYITSKEIIQNYKEKFEGLLKEIGKIKEIKNFPMHIEIRVTKEGKIIPIEINPMRFAGWCTTDVANYAWGINVYEYFLGQKKPDWNKILENSGDEMYYFSMAEVPSGITNDIKKSFDYDRFLANYSNILELRKIDPENNPLFAVIFGSIGSNDEVKRILGLKTKDYIKG